MHSFYEQSTQKNDAKRIYRGLRSGYAAGLPVWFYREDAKGSADKSVRDRFTALLRSLCDASVGYRYASRGEPSSRGTRLRRA